MEKWIAFEKGKINYTVNGEGPVVVLLHGFLEDHTIWNDFAAKLAGKYKVIAIDLPGFGKTSNFNKIHSMAYMANTVFSVLADEFVDKCIMIGHSMGGYVTLAFAMNNPDKLNGIVLFHSQAAADTEEGKKNRDRTIEVIESDHHAFIHSFVPSLFAEQNVKKYEAEIEKLRKLSMSTSRNGIVAALAGMRDRPDYADMLSKLEIPVFFIIGKQDSRVNMEMMFEQMKAPQNCEAMILDHVGHMGFIEASDITYLAIEHFVERNNQISL
jgi:pimeloyl-ACP methyl ester carboxylesterase